MRKRHWGIAIIAMLLLLVAMSRDAPSAHASDEPVQSFGECVAQRGDVRLVADDLTCRQVHAYDFRVYGTATTDCGEEVHLEIWGETRSGVVTYFMAPGRTFDLPEVGEADMVLPEEPLPCMDD